MSMCLPNHRDLDTWFEAVYALPIAWPDVTDIGAHYFQRTSANQLQDLRSQLGVSHMWGEISPKWRLLRHHLWNYGPNYLNAQQLEDLLILNRPCRPGDDVKDHQRPYSHKAEWREWERVRDEIGRIASHAAPQIFVDENEAVNHILQVIRRDAISIGINYEQLGESDSYKDDRATKRRRKEESQGKARA